jgi:hypothetical protein
VIGVVKAYTTRVGSGPFPSEQLNGDGEKLQQDISNTNLDLIKVVKDIKLSQVQRGVVVDSVRVAA